VARGTPRPHRHPSDGGLASALHSIRWRLALWISALLILTVAAGLAIVYSQTSRRLNAQIRQDLNADVAQLHQSLRIAEGDSRAEVLSDIAHYVSGQPFQKISTLLFVLAPHQTISNYPELFAKLAPDDGESAAAQSAENAQALRFGRPLLGMSTHAVPDVGKVRVLERRVTVDGLALVIGAGEPLISLIRAQHSIVHSFALAAVFIVLVALLGSYLVGTRLTAPLRRMARVAAQVDAGELAPRMDSEQRRRDEIGVLASAFNHMLDRLEQGFRGQRDFIADASHELRTPLTVIQGQLEVLANRREVDRQEISRVARLVGGEVGRMRRIVDDLLLLAQAERPDFVSMEEIDFQRFIEEIWDGATLIAARNFELGDLPAGRLQADPDRLAQAIRNLINNAIDHTREGDGTIRLQARAGADGWVAITLLDNGPGIPEPELERIFHRFHRTSESRARGARARSIGGAGLGLAIVRAIAQAHGGEVLAANRPQGGARFELRLPGFIPAVSESRGPAPRPSAAAIPDSGERLPT
jgi:two-component system OmpR family sensor kinase